MPLIAIPNDPNILETGGRTPEPRTPKFVCEDGFRTQKSYCAWTTFLLNYEPTNKHDKEQTA